MEEIIAIDPDIEKNGICVISNNRVELFSFNFSTLAFVFFKNLRGQLDSNPGLKIKLFVEAGFLNKIYFNPYNKNQLAIGKINRNIGENHAASKLIIESAKYYNLDPIPCFPVKSTNYRDRGKKITHPQFVRMIERNNLICNVEVTNQEIRDAALIAVTYGINQENSNKDVATEKKKIPQFFAETTE